MGQRSGRDHCSLSSSSSFLGSQQALVGRVHLFVVFPSVGHPCWAPVRTETTLVLSTLSSDARSAPGTWSRYCEIRRGPLDVGDGETGQVPFPAHLHLEQCPSDPAGRHRGAHLDGRRRKPGAPPSQRPLVEAQGRAVRAGVPAAAWATSQPLLSPASLACTRHRSPLRAQPWGLWGHPALLLTPACGDRRTRASDRPQAGPRAGTRHAQPRR